MMVSCSVSVVANNPSNLESWEVTRNITCFFSSGKAEMVCADHEIVHSSGIGRGKNERESVPR